MPTDSRLDRYLRHRRRWEIGLILAWGAINTLANCVVVLMDVERAGLGFAVWKPVLWETSSTVVILALLPAILAFEKRVPLQGFATDARRTLVLHLAGSLAFSLAHVLAMVGLRKAVYALVGQSYDFGPWPRELFYEYLKDVRSYGGFLAIVWLYRLLLLRLQGEARLLAAPDEGPPVEPIERPERFLVRKLGKEFLIAARDIEWLEAAENYVNLHVRGHVYPLRSTMAAIEQRLDPQRFVRVHRRYIVNLDQLVQIEPLDSGDARLLLKDGSRIPCSRRQRAALRSVAAVAETAAA